jgi:hypothetical protein
MRLMGLGSDEGAVLIARFGVEQTASSLQEYLPLCAGQRRTGQRHTRDNNTPTPLRTLYRNHYRTFFRNLYRTFFRTAV